MGRQRRKPGGGIRRTARRFGKRSRPADCRQDRSAGRSAIAADRPTSAPARRQPDAKRPGAVRRQRPARSRSGLSEKPIELTVGRSLLRWVDDFAVEGALGRSEVEEEIGHSVGRRQRIRVLAGQGAGLAAGAGSEARCRSRQGADERGSSQMPFGNSACRPGRIALTTGVLLASLIALPVVSAQERPPRTCLP